MSVIKQLIIINQTNLLKKNLKLLYRLNDSQNNSSVKLCYKSKHKERIFLNASPMDDKQGMIVCMEFVIFRIPQPKNEKSINLSCPYIYMSQQFYSVTASMVQQITCTAAELEIGPSLVIEFFYQDFLSNSPQLVCGVSRSYLRKHVKPSNSCCVVVLPEYGNYSIKKNFCLRIVHKWCTVISSTRLVPLTENGRCGRIWSERHQCFV